MKLGIALVLAWFLSSLSFKIRVKLSMAIVLASLLSWLGPSIPLAFEMALVLARLFFLAMLFFSKLWHRGTRAKHGAV